MRVKTNTISLVVPCYNEEASIDAFVNEVHRVQKKLLPVNLEIIFVNDGSKDCTLARLEAIQEASPDHISYLSFSRNFGKEAAILAGLEHAHGEWVALLDADLQHPPSLLEEMYHKLIKTDCDVVATKRRGRKGDSWLRRVLSKAYYRIAHWVSDIYIDEDVRDYRLMTQQVVQAVLTLHERNRYSKGIFTWVGFETEYVEFDNHERLAGQSNWSFRSLFNYALDSLTSFSELPLTIASVIGLVTFLVAVIYGVYILASTLFFGNQTDGWPTLVLLIVGFSGLQLLCLGLLGKYIGKIFIESKHRPMYIIKEKKLAQTTKNFVDEEQDHTKSE